MQKKHSHANIRPRIKRPVKKTDHSGRNHEMPGEKRGFFHKIWFSKNPNAESNFHFGQNEAEKKSEEFHARDSKKEVIKQDDLEKSLSLMKDILAELRLQNESLRKDRQFFFEKLNEIMEKGQNPAYFSPEGKTPENPAGRNTTEKRLLGSTIVETNSESAQASSGKNSIIVESKQNAQEYKMKKGKDSPGGKGKINEAKAPVENQPRMDLMQGKIKEFSGQAQPDNSEKITTSLDSLLDLIAQTSIIKVPEAAKRLHVKDKQVEDWAHVLEEHGLIDIHYPTFGKPVLKKKGAQNAR
jgi:hypothetical protein